MPYIEDDTPEEDIPPRRKAIGIGIAALMVIVATYLATSMDDEPHPYSSESVQHFVNRDAYPMLWKLEEVHQITGETWIARDWDEADVAYLADKICQYAYESDNFTEFQQGTIRFWGDSSHLFVGQADWQSKAVMASWLLAEERCSYVIPTITPVVAP